MKVTTHNIELASAMTKLLTRENLDIMFGNFQTAAADPKSRTVFFPTRFIGLNRDIMTVFTAHEGAHILYSSPDYKEDYKAHGSHIVNILEDCRIERLIKRDFIGLGPFFERGYKSLDKEHDFFSLKNIDVSKLSLIDKINLKAKLGSGIEVNFSEKEKIFFDRALSTESWEDVIELAQDYNTEVNKKKEETPENLNQNPEDDNEFEEFPNPSNDNDDSEEEEEGEENSNGDDSEEFENFPIPLNDNDDLEEGGNDDLGEEEGGNDDLEEEGITTKSEKDWAANYNKSAELNWKTARIPEYSEVSRHIISYKTLIAARSTYSSCSDKKVVSIMTEVKKNAQVMASEFEAKKAAFQNLRAKESKSGEINESSLVHYKYSNEIFHTKIQLATAKNHGMIVFIDFSGSMQPIIGDVLKQVLTLVEFCKRVQIPFEVYAFSNNPIIEQDAFPYTPSSTQTRRSTIDKVETFCQTEYRSQLNLFSSKMSKADYAKAFQQIAKISITGTLIGIESLHGTPLTETLVDRISITDHFLKEHQIQKLSTIFLTDGFGQNTPTSNNLIYKNKLFSSDERISENDYYNYSGNRQNIFLYKIYKKLFPNSTVSNLFLISSRTLPYSAQDQKTLDEFQKTGTVMKPEPKEYDIEYFIKVSTRSSTKTLYSYFDKDLSAQEIALNKVESEFLEKSKSGKKQNAISRKIVSFFA